jgi:imidazole glycerol-phosphate synthase subunit HisH
MKRVAIVDYGMCNLDSVRRAVEECGADAEVTDRASALRDASHVILPGVGAFPDAMTHLRERQLDGALRELAAEDRVPFLGICLGMQLMATRGEEGGETAGLGIVPGDIVRLQPDDPRSRIPHVGWNQVVPERPSPLFAGIAPERDFYFVHSYHFVPRDGAQALARTPYCGGFVSAVGTGQRTFGVQFHPEKSQKVGFALLRNFIGL